MLCCTLMFQGSLSSVVDRQTLCSLHTRVVAWGVRGAVVSFCFDDFPRTAYLVGGAILKDLGARATYYAAPGLMGTTNVLGEQFCQKDLDALLQDGHELGSHTFSHISCRTVSFARYCEDFERGKKAIAEIVRTRDSGNFAYPFGDVTMKAKRLLGPKTRSSRSIFPGLNGIRVDLNLLRANSLYGDVDQSPSAQNLILENEKRMKWLIFYCHDVRSNHSLYGCTPRLLAATASFAVARGCRILTIDQVLTEIGVSAPPSTDTC